MDEMYEMMDEIYDLREHDIRDIPFSEEEEYDIDWGEFLESVPIDQARGIQIIEDMPEYRFKDV